MLVLLAMALVSIDFLSSSSDLSDRLAEVADVIAGGTAALGVVAGLIAIQAYAAATGLPKLEVQIWFAASEKNNPVFRARRTPAGLLEAALPAEQTTAAVSLRNRSHYSANGVVVIVKLSSVMSGLDSRSSFGDKWTVFEFPDIALGSKELVVQWDSGADGVIHGGAGRRLPDLRLGPLSCTDSWAQPMLEVEIIADGGYHRAVQMPVYFLEDGQQLAGDSATAKSREWR